VYFVAVMIAVSRLFVGMHYPSDVLAGAVLGTLSAAVVYVLARRLPVMNEGSRNDGK
jgi:undecaprenyl-diphosphatase